MRLNERRATGLEAIELATELLRRIRVSHPEGGLWDVGSVQWWWRRESPTDQWPQQFWHDADGPVACVLITQWNDRFQVDPIVLPGVGGDMLSITLERGVETARSRAAFPLDIFVRDDDVELQRLAINSGFSRLDAEGGGMWTSVVDRAASSGLPDGLVLTDRASHRDGDHWLTRRNGSEAEGRLQELSLYDPELDLAVLAPDGSVAGYALFWNDTATRTGMLEPMRVEDEYQRRGLATALIAEGLSRLADRGAERVQVGYGSETGRALYARAGFRVAWTSGGYTLEATTD